MKRRPDLKDLEREILAAAERARVDAQELVERLRGEAGAHAERLRGEAQAKADRFRSDAQATAGRFRSDAQATVDRVKDEGPRKAVHLAAISIPLGLLHLPIVPARRTLMIIAAGFLVIDLAKISQPRLRSWFLHFFGAALRRHERDDITASTYLVVSALLCSYLFEIHTAAAALVFLIIGDTMAAVVGKAWGRIHLFGKTLEGFLAGWVSATLAAWAIVPEVGLLPLTLAAFVAMVVEIAPLPVDDNFRIPLVAGLVLEWLR